uniref:Ig-like domain-containing protein n=1 Tax=Erpetoichthys calabaricus TaxID=27687 RepID=A0A8C4RTT4_ERPCA
MLLKTLCLVNFCLILAARFCTVGIVTLKQKRNIILKPGQNTDIACEQDGTDEYMYWYRQTNMQGLQLLLFSRYENMAIEKVTVDEGFSGTRTERKSFPLHISNVQKNYSAVYFCASSRHSAVPKLSYYTKTENYVQL